MTICGGPLLRNGQEFGEDYSFPEDGNGPVASRPLRWRYSKDGTGQWLRTLYQKLIAIRHAHPALLSQNFYHGPYDEQLTQFNGQGYGVNEQTDTVFSPSLRNE